MNETNWNMASNTQLKEELERLENLFNKKPRIKYLLQYLIRGVFI